MVPYDNPDWEALLKGIVAAPDDDMPRLVAADWLEEHNEVERAEFIRLQCELSQYLQLDRKRFLLLRWRETELLNSPTAGQLWAWEACPHIVTMAFQGSGGLSGLEIRWADRVRFERGFPVRLVCPAEEWYHHGQLVVPRQPLREVRLLHCDETTLEFWWPMLETLKYVPIIDIDSRRNSFLTWLRTHLPNSTIHRG
jgi:uncharacterized protein (TIGR02996 family)